MKVKIYKPNVQLLFLFAFLLVTMQAFSQPVPTDAWLLKRIYGKSDNNNKTFTRPFREGEGDHSYKDSVTYSIVFKQETELGNQKVWVVIVEAPNSSQHGHRLGYMDLYFFKNTPLGFELIDSLVSESESPLGDISDYSIIEIGKGKKALISTFQSTGNQHLENTKTVCHLEIGALTYLFNIYTEYDNSAWKIPLAETDDCAAEKYTETFEVIQSEKSWSDVKVTHTNYQFTKGCKDEKISEAREFTLVYDGKKYQEMKTN
jgi:hypothetical protein